jgi:hypothetical protein
VSVRRPPPPPKSCSLSFSIFPLFCANLWPKWPKNLSPGYLGIFAGSLQRLVRQSGKQCSIRILPVFFRTIERRLESSRSLSPLQGEIFIERSQNACVPAR